MTILSPSSEDTRIYEVTILYPYKLNQKEEKQILDEVSTVFEEAGAKLIESDMWGRRGLAYTIEGHDEGNFAIFYYEMDPLKVREADEAMLIIPGVLRHMIVKPPKGYELVKYSDQHKKWMKERETESERKGREREEEIKRRVAEKAKRQVKRNDEQKKATKENISEKSPVKKEKLSEELDKIISDDELNL